MSLPIAQRGQYPIVHRANQEKVPRVVQRTRSKVADADFFVNAIITNAMTMS
jgi:hypothetical protein